MIRHDLTGWRSQYEMMQRSYAKLLNKYCSSVEYGDDLRHFFQDCWHLKDWIKNDKNASIIGSVETEVNGCKALVIAGDLANGCKHLKLIRGKSSEGAEATAVNVTVPIVGGPAEIDYTIQLDDGSTLSDKDAARAAYEAWDPILRKLGLIS